MVEIVAKSYHSNVSPAALINFNCLITHINGKGVMPLEMLFSQD